MFPVLYRGELCFKHDFSTPKKQVMKKITIEKFVHGVPEKSFSVPVWTLRFAQKILPDAAWRALAKEKLDMQELMQAIKQNTPYSCELSIHEGGIDKKIIISFSG